MMQNLHLRFNWMKYKNLALRRGPLLQHMSIVDPHHPSPTETSLFSSILTCRYYKTNNMPMSISAKLPAFQNIMPRIIKKMLNHSLLTREPQKRLVIGTILRSRRATANGVLTHALSVKDTHMARGITHIVLVSQRPDTIIFWGGCL